MLFLNFEATNLEVKPIIVFVLETNGWSLYFIFFSMFFNAQITVVLLSAFSGSTINKGYPFDSGVLETFYGCGSTGQLLFIDFF